MRYPSTLGDRNHAGPVKPVVRKLVLCGVEDVGASLRRIRVFGSSHRYFAFLKRLFTDLLLTLMLICV